MSPGNTGCFGTTVTGWSRRGNPTAPKTKLPAGFVRRAVKQFEANGNTDQVDCGGSSVAITPSIARPIGGVNFFWPSAW